MLGLGLGSHKASALRSLAAKLLAKLRGRSNYYENNQDSKDTIHEIDSYELLDKASILLTPTATSDARVHSVKTYTGENILIGNNSTFDSDVGDWVSYGAGTPSHSTDKLEVSVTASEGGAMIPTNSLFTGGQSGKTLKVRAKLWLGTMTNTAFKAYIGGVQENVTISSTPTYYEFYLKPTGSGNLIIYKTTISGSEGTFFIDDVSVVDVSSDFDFDRASSATRINSSGLVQDMQSITDPELVLNGDFEELGDNVLIGNNSTFDSGIGDWTTYTNGIIAHDTNKLEVTLVSGGGAKINTSSLFTGGQVGKTLKIRARIWQGTTTRSNIAIYVGSVQETVNISSTPTYFEVYLKPTSTGYLTIYSSSDNGTFFIDDVSVQQVDPNDRWTVGATWSLGDGVANYEGGSNSAIIQNITLTSGNTYNIKFTVSNASGNASIWIGDGAGGVNYFGGTYAPYANGSYDLYFTMPSNQTTLAFYGASSGSNFSIDNISLKDITFSTDVDLARINYDSNGDNGHILLEPTSTNIITYSEDFTQNSTESNSVLATSNQAISPDGTLNADKLIPANGNVQSNGGRYYSHSSTGGTDYSVSIFVKQAEYRYVTFTYGSNSAYGFHFDLQDGVILQNINNAAYTSIGREVESFGNGWYRLKISLTDNSTVSNRFISVRPANAIPTATNNNYSTIGDGTSGIYAWGFQLEALSYATSYIPTLTGGTVTRAADTMPYDASPIKTPTGSQAVLYLEIATNETTNRTFGGFVESSTAMYGLYHWANVDNNKFGFNTWNGDCYGFTDADFLLDGNFHKIAALFDFTDFTENKLFIDGIQYSLSQVRSTTIQRSASALALDAPSANERPIASYKTVAVFNEALSDDELELLTGVTNYGSFGELASANGYTII